MKVIHYGNTEILSDKFYPIKNRMFTNKPHGGLWTSPINSKYSWKNWNNNSNFIVCDDNNSVTLNIRDDAKILEINSKTILSDLPIISHEFSILNVLDFEEIVKTYDCLHLTVSGLKKFSDIMYNLSFYGWARNSNRNN